MKARAFTRQALCMACVLLVSLGAASASTIHVDVDGTGDYPSLQAAFAVAQSGDVIVVGAGVYTGAANRDLVLAGKVLTIQSSDPGDPNVVAETVIDCQATDGFGHRFIEITPNTGAALTLAGLKITNATGAFSGGVILCKDATLNLSHCTFLNNSAQWWGGAVHCEDSEAVIENCTFKNNVSVALHGGAVFGQNSVLNLNDCTFLKNSGTALKFFDSTASVVGCTFDKNVGREGGALYGNTSLDTDAPLDLNLTDCTFVENVCETSGGAVYCYAIEATIDACTFTANSAAENGGAIYNHRSSPAITNCVFSGNVATSLGGAVANYYASDAEIVHTTFVQNVAASGGAVSSWRESHPLLAHCILWNNQADQGDSLSVVGETLGLAYTSQATVEYCDVEGGSASAHRDSGCTLTWGSGNLNVDPLFTGQTFGDYHLSSDSACIDAGDPMATSVTADRDGRTRPYGKATDLGAYEYQGLGPVYRFWSASQSRHFYTISAEERDMLIDRYADVWQFEDIAYYAFYQNSEANLVPVHRFWSAVLNSHIWTTSEEEKDKLIKSASETWAYEGIVFYAYDAGKAPLGTSPVYRFWSAKHGYHFYTMVESERDWLLTEYPNVWSLEKIAFCTYSTPYKPGQITYDFSGDAKNARYTMTLGAYVDGKEAQIDLSEATFTVTSARLQMTTDFVNETTTLEALRLAGELVEHTGTIRQSGIGAVSLPFAISADATFKALSPRGPFPVDPATGIFADFVEAPESFRAEEETFAFKGLTTLGDRTSSFDLTAEAVQLDLQSFGAFGSLNLLSEGVSASLPQTFQWLRPNVRDLLAETMVDGHLVQLFVTRVCVDTEDIWDGKAID